MGEQIKYVSYLLLGRKAEKVSSASFSIDPWLAHPYIQPTRLPTRDALPTCADEKNLFLRPCRNLSLPSTRVTRSGEFSPIG
jgi:hypothetical protein